MNGMNCFQADLRRALRNHAYELTDDGRVYVPAGRFFAGGVFIHEVNGRDRRIDPNMLVSEGLIDILKVYFANSAQRTAFYLAPFSGNVAVAPGLTAASFAATQVEFTNYSEAQRPVWTPDAITTPNAANTGALATLTINADNQTVWGFGMLTALAKQATTGVLVACSQFAAARSGLLTGDKLSVQYSIAAQDA